MVGQGIYGLKMNNLQIYRTNSPDCRLDTVRNFFPICKQTKSYAILLKKRREKINF